MCAKGPDAILNLLRQRISNSAPINIGMFCVRSILLAQIAGDAFIALFRHETDAVADITCTRSRFGAAVGVCFHLMPRCPTDTWVHLPGEESGFNLMLGVGLQNPPKTTTENNNKKAHNFAGNREGLFSTSASGLCTRSFDMMMRCRWDPNAAERVLSLSGLIRNVLIERSPQPRPI